MNRRSFCKIAASSAIMAALFPSRLIGATAGMRPCTVSVLRCECHGDLQSQFSSDPEAGPCPMLTPGMSWRVTQGDGHVPEGMCPKAWNVLRSHLSEAAQGCSCGGKTAIVACPDGIRPVIFKINYF